MLNNNYNYGTYLKWKLGIDDYLVIIYDLFGMHKPSHFLLIVNPMLIFVPCRFVFVSDQFISTFSSIFVFIFVVYLINYILYDILYLVGYGHNYIYPLHLSLNTIIVL